MTLNTNALLIDARLHDLGDMTIRRVLPFARAGAVRRHVGPFVFLDHIGPIETENPFLYPSILTSDSPLQLTSSKVKFFIRIPLDPNR